MRDRLALIAFGVAMVVTPIIVLIFDDQAKYYDALRSFVIAQAVVVLCLMFYTIIWVARRMSSANPATKPDTAARKVVLGGLTRNFGVLILIFMGLLAVIGRLGNTHLDYKTPLFQFSLLLLFYAWALIDRRIYRGTRTPQELVSGVVEEAVEEAKKIADEMDVEVEK